ncbi:type II secretion system protein [Gordonibacter sp. 28C]|uniref:type II secretion system F family protein n=1 Tax=Gordonibacter sp. 28C TaxID=2078569 RepID=UPI000DF74E4C|nr:type II secretion system F family protein [Gordonibacter sp. 28C]RDB62017.1 type II secretion system protein [Gordonibacter sp. 28C]
MVYIATSTAIAAACVFLAAKVLACVREDRLEQRRREALVGSREPSKRAEAGRRSKGTGPAGVERDTPLAKSLRAAGIGMAPRRWAALVAGASATAGICAAAASGAAALGPVAAGAVLAAAQLLVRRRSRARSDLFDVQLAHALPQIAAGLRGSLTLERALRVALVHMDDPLRGEVAHVLADAAYGMPLHEALDAMARRTQSQDVRTLASATRMRQGSGGSVAAALAMISSRVNARLKAARELKVEVAGTRLAKWFVAGAMPAIFLIMYATNGDFARFYATEPLGWAVLGIAAAMEAAGLAMSHAVTSLERR